MKTWHRSNEKADRKRNGFCCIDPRWFARWKYIQDTWKFLRCCFWPLEITISMTGSKVTLFFGLGVTLSLLSLFALPSTASPYRMIRKWFEEKWSEHSPFYRSVWWTILSHKTVTYRKEASFLATEEANKGVICPWAGLKIFEEAQEPIFFAQVFRLFRI